ncbi:MAG: hypothetical protein WC312_08380 [Candidatus Omnitrophota bacterium]|jgi:hypothetical protein
MKKSGKRIVVNISIVIAGIFLIIAILEIMLRVFPDKYTHINNPYRYTKFLGEFKYGVPFHSYCEIYPVDRDNRKYYKKGSGIIKYNFNQFGARWIKPQNQEIRGDKKIFVIGDSFTLGFGLRYEDTYIYKTQALLREDGLKYDFINFSFPAADSRACLENYIKKRGMIRHNMLLYGMHLNDLLKFPTSYVICDIHGYETRIRNKSKLADFILKRLEKEKSWRENIEKLLDPSMLNSDYFVQNMDAIKQMDRETKRLGVDFAVVILPILADLREETFRPVYNRIKRLLDEYGIKYLDLTASVAGYEDISLWILPFDQHPNEIANSIFAQELRNFFKKYK